MALPRMIDDLSDRGDHKVGLIELDPMAALCRDNVTALRRKIREEPVAGDRRG